MPNTFFTLDVPISDGPGTPTDTSQTGSPKTFVLTGSPRRGRYIVEGSNDGATWDVLIGLDGTQCFFGTGSATAKTVDAIVRFVRIRSIGNGAGPSPVSIAMGAPPATGTNVFGVLDVPVSGGVGAAFDLGASAGPLKTFTLRGPIPQRSRYTLLASMDGEHFDEVALYTADQEGARAVSVVCRYLRVERSAGGPAPVITVGAEGLPTAGAGLSSIELSLADESEKATSAPSGEEVLAAYTVPLVRLTSATLGVSFAGVSVQGAVPGTAIFRVRAGGSLTTPDGTVVGRVVDSAPGAKNIGGELGPFPRPAGDVIAIKITGEGDGTVRPTLRGFVLVFHAPIPGVI